MEISFKRNLGNTDRIIRTIIGLVLLGVAFSLFPVSPVWSMILTLLAVFDLIQAALGY